MEIVTLRSTAIDERTGEIAAAHAAAFQEDPDAVLRRLRDATLPTEIVRGVDQSSPRGPFVLARDLAGRAVSGVSGCAGATG
ncbi:MAG TPA: hypothetical protein VNL94_04505 [Candidatus Binatia bacterium]|nr:hypothetical protein [Candidatus Binatia bacterium]